MTIAKRLAQHRGLNEYVIIEIDGKGIVGEVVHDTIEEFTYRVHDQENIDPRYLTIYTGVNGITESTRATLIKRLTSVARLTSVGRPFTYSKNQSTR
jgi:hypothetical protein